MGLQPSPSSAVRPTAHRDLPTENLILIKRRNHVGDTGVPPRHPLLAGGPDRVRGNVLADREAEAESVTGVVRGETSPLHPGGVAAAVAAAARGHALHRHRPVATVPAGHRVRVAAVPATTTVVHATATGRHHRGRQFPARVHILWIDRPETRRNHCPVQQLQHRTATMVTWTCG